MNTNKIGKEMIKLRVNIAFLIVGLLIGGLVYAVHADTTTPFDHSTCQYPDRLSNPPDGCDNSDPACGEVAKGATQCPVDQPVQTQPTQNTPVAPQPIQPTQSNNQCGGKNNAGN